MERNETTDGRVFIGGVAAGPLLGRYELTVDPELYRRIGARVKSTDDDLSAYLAACANRIEGHRPESRKHRLRGLSRFAERASVPLTIPPDDIPPEEGELEIDKAAMWRLATKEFYADADPVALATREALQNGVDAVRTAMKQNYGNGKPIEREFRVRKGEGYFRVRWEPKGARGTLHFEDNGIGMDRDVLAKKFLTLAASGKGDGDGSVGGFGMAKAVIIGVSTTGRWEIHTRDIGARSVPGGIRYELRSMPMRKGTLISVHDIPTSAVYSSVLQISGDPNARIGAVLGWSYVPDITLLHNDDEVSSQLSTKDGYRLEYDDANWGAKTKVDIRRYKGIETIPQGFYTRLAGLLQYVMTPYEKVRGVYVFDITTTFAPREPGYPLKASRDSWHGASAMTFRKVVESIIEETRAENIKSDWEIYLPDSADPAERKGAAQIADGLREIAEEPGFNALITDLMKSVQEVADLHGGDEEDPKSPYDRSADWSMTLPDNVKTIPALQRLGNAAKEAVLLGVDQIPEDVFEVVLATAGQIADGEVPTAAETTDLIRAIGGAVDTITEGKAGESSVVLRVGFDKLLHLLAEAAAKDEHAKREQIVEARKAADQVNPFGGAAIVKVSKTNTKPEIAKNFMKNAAAYIPLLILWDLTLRLVVQASGGRMPSFKPGFVVDRTLRGMTTSDGDAGTRGFRRFVMLEPLRFQEFFDAHRNNPATIANYLHGIACHEVAHLPYMGKGHFDDWAIEREDLARATYYLLPAIEEAVNRLLKLPHVAPPFIKKLTNADLTKAGGRIQARIAELEAQVTAMRARDVRMESVTREMDDKVVDLAKRLRRIMEFSQYEEYLRGPGAALLPRGVTPDELLVAVREYPTAVASAILGLGEPLT